MVRPVAVAVAALLVLAATAAAAPPASEPTPEAVDSPPGPAAVPEQVSPPNTTSVLLLEGAERGDVYDPGVDLSTALAADHAVTGERIAAAALRERYRAAEPGERAAVLRAALDRISARTTAANAAERNVRRGYANGSYTAAETARRLGRLDATARSLDATLDGADARANDLSETELRSRASDVEHRLATVRGPVRGQVAATLRGQDNASRVYVAGTQSGLRLATVEDGVHYHESSRPVSDEGGQRASIAEVERRVAELYPWAWNNSRGTTVDAVGSDTYRATIEHPHGSLVSYVDATSLDVVREIQRRQVEELPTGPSVTTERDGLRVAVNRTYPGGPLRVAVRDGADGGADVTVRVDDVVVGRTGSDGVMWTVAPDGGPDNRFIVTAERGDEQLSLIVQPTQPSSGA